MEESSIFRTIAHRNTTLAGVVHFLIKKKNLRTNLIEKHSSCDFIGVNWVAVVHLLIWQMQVVFFCLLSNYVKVLFFLGGNNIKIDSKSVQYSCYLIYRAIYLSKVTVSCCECSCHSFFEVVPTSWLVVQINYFMYSNVCLLISFYVFFVFSKLLLYTTRASFLYKRLHN